jgi:threonine synthase
MLSPHGKMSAFQRAQMYSLQDANIFNIAVRGMFDDARTSSKRSPTTRLQGASTRSARSIRSTGRVSRRRSSTTSRAISRHPRNDEQVDFAVPSGNFGNICAGHIARMMGLPIARLVLATNENDVLDEFFRTGVYRPRSTAETSVTSSPSMDISKASNFERFVFDLVGRDPTVVRELWSKVDAGGSFDLSGTPYFGANAASASSRAAAPRRPPGHDPPCGCDYGTDDRHPHRRRPQGGAGTPRGRHADDRAGNRAAGEVRGNHPRGARAGWMRNTSAPVWRPSARAAMPRAAS